MGFFWTNAFTTAVNASATIATGPVNVKLRLMSRAPLLDPEGDTRASLKGITTIASLLALDGWEEVSSSGYTAQTNSSCTITSSGANRYLTLGSTLSTFTGMGDSQVEALVLTVPGANLGLGAGDHVIFATTTPFQGNKVIFRAGDSITAQPDTNAGNARWFFGWALSSGSVNAVVEGTTALQQGAPTFEVSRIHHAWMYPQRVNYVANPSFETGVTHWQTNRGAVTRQAATYPSPWVGSVSFYPLTGSVAAPTPGTAAAETAYAASTAYHGMGGSTGGTGAASGTAFGAAVQTSVLPQFAPERRLYLKSSPFYPRSDLFTFQVMASGQGIARVGLAYYPRDYNEYAAEWGLQDDMFFQEWQLETDRYVRMQGVRQLSDSYEVALIIEVRGVLTDPNNPSTLVPPSITIDQALVEEGVVTDWPYFDGDSTFGAPGDFSWYGDATYSAKQGKSYSLWYNNRRSIAGRLFGRRLDDTALYTSYDEQLDSLVSQWTPAGSVVYPHWDVLSVDDTEIVPLDKSATTLPVTLWPELSQPFQLFEVLEVTPTFMRAYFIGEGAYPISKAYVLTNGVTRTTCTISTRPWEEPGLTINEIAALKAELFDMSIAQEVTITWGAIPAFATHTLYIERGDAESPQSYLSYDLTQGEYTDAAGVAMAAGTGYNAKVTTPSSPVTATAAGVADNVSLTVFVSAGAAAATGAAYQTDSGSRSAFPSTATATGAGIDAESRASNAPVAITATATGAAQNASVTVSASAATVTATGFGQDANINYGEAADAATATGAAFNAGTTVTASVGTATATGLGFDTDNYKSVNGGLAAASGAAFNAFVSVTFPVGTATASGAANTATPNVQPYPSTGTAAGAMQAIFAIYNRPVLTDEFGNVVFDENGLPIYLD